MKAGGAYLNTYEHPEVPESLRIDKSNTFRLLRGGSWNNTPGYLRVSTRNWVNASARFDFIGFRLVQDIP